MAVEGDKSVSDAITDYYYFPSAEELGTYTCRVLMLFSFIFNYINVLLVLRRSIAQKMRK